MLTCNRLDLEHQDLNQLCPKISTDTASISKQRWDMWVLTNTLPSPPLLLKTWFISTKLDIVSSVTDSICLAQY